MNAITPMLKDQDKLSPLASRYVDVEDLPWKPSGNPGIDMKVLLKDEKTGLMTCLFRWAPGSSLPMHRHVQIEQSWVLEGELEDDEGVCTKGNFVWRPAGSTHVARAPKGALILAMFLEPNILLDGANAGKRLE